MPALSHYGRQSAGSDGHSRSQGHDSAFTMPCRTSGAFIHGTRFANFLPIMTHGLRAKEMHIYMADEMRPDGSLPGLDDKPEVVFFVDEGKVASEGFTFDYDP